MPNLKSYIFIALFAWGHIALAYPPGLSSAEFTLGDNQTDATITFAIQDIEAFILMDTDQDAEVTATEMDAAKPTVATWVANDLQLTIDHNLVKPVTEGSVIFDDQNNAQVRFQFDSPVKQQLQLQSQFLNKLRKRPALPLTQ